MNEVNSNIIDESTGQPIADAMVYAEDQGGNATAVARSSQSGSFQASLPDYATSILVVAPGYASKTFDTGSISSSGSVKLSRSSVSGDAITSVIKNNTASSIPWYVWVSGIGIVLYATQEKKSSRISGEKTDYSKYVLPAGLVVLAYLALKSFNLFGPSSSSQNAESVDKSTAKANADSLAAAAAAGDFATLTDSQAAGIADAIFQAGLQNDAYTAKLQIIQANTLTDLLKIISAFGTKKADISSFSPCSLFGLFCQSYNLNAWLHTPFMDQVTLSQINSYLSAQHINYQF